jgi:hypothetical protein
MEFFEKDLEEIIFYSDKNELNKRGLCLHGKLKRQLKIGNYGIADLIDYVRPMNWVGKEGMVKGEINVIELKNKKIGVSTFFQALNYLHGIQRFLDKKGIKDNYNYKITLIGREFDQHSSFCYLGDVFGGLHYPSSLKSDTRIAVNLLTYSYGLDGISFTEVSEYELSNEGF